MFARLSFIIVGALLLHAGCSEVGEGSGLNKGAAPPQNDQAASAPTGRGETTFDAGNVDAALANGASPLCGLKNTCVPDETTSDACKQPPDAGTQSDDDTAQLGNACRVTKQQGETTYGPQCLVGKANYRGTDGVACESSTDCAPGFDCVGPSGGAEHGQVCRHYCCTGSCEGQKAQNGGPTYCEPQPLVPTSDGVRIPVCMPFKKCELLQVDACSRGESCAVVNDKGDTGCVATGPSKEGDSCDREQCAANLTCLGTVGDRKCYRLCLTKRPECGEGQSCITASVFQDSKYGVCKKN